MLDISKLEAGLLGVWRRPCSVPELIKNVAGLLRARIESKRIRLTTCCAENLPAVYCDEEKAQRVLINLAVNAVKFTPDEGQVDIWAKRSDDGAEVIIGVTDSGPGICPSNLAVIFDRFKQVETNLRSSTKGFGLGLNIAKELVRLNLGQINVESEVGHGSTFSFSLPVNDLRIALDRYIDRRAPQEADDPSISVLLASFDDTFAAEAAPVVDEFLQRSVRVNDLVLHTGSRSWLIACACAECDAASVIARLQQSWDDYQRNYPSVCLPALRIIYQGTQSARDAGLLRAQLDCAGERAARHSAVGKKVLVVDDDREVNSCLGLRLEAAGFEVLSAFDGNEGLATAIERHPDAVVLDVRMPNKDGLTMLRELRSSSNEVRDTPVVMLSASVRDQHRALEAGASYFVTKPYDAKDVISALESSINKGPSNATAQYSAH
jgi:CheY-like chemotaxis protein